MNGKWKLWTYPVMDIKAAQAELERMDRMGWHLNKVYLGFLARFVPAEAHSSWWVDWSDQTCWEKEDYVQLCADAGWTLVQQTGYMSIYRAIPGTLPIQTDGAEEYRRFRHEVYRRMWKGWLLAAVLLALLGVLLLPGLSAYETPRDALRQLVLYSFSYSIFLVLDLALLPLALLGGVVWLVRFVRCQRRWRRAAQEDQPLPVPSRRSAEAMKTLAFLGYAYWWIGWAAYLKNLTDQLGIFLICLGIAYFWSESRRDRWEKDTKRKRKEQTGQRNLLILLLGGLVIWGCGMAVRPFTPPLPEAVAAADSQYNRTEEKAILLSSGSWQEYRDHELWREVTTWNARLTWLADLAQEEAAAGLEPMEAGLWRSERARDPEYEDRWNQTLVLRQGNQILRVTCSTTTPLDEAGERALLDAMQETLTGERSEEE